MVIDEINVGCMTVYEAKNHAVICSHRYRVEALEVALQWVKAKPREVEIFGYSGAVENCEYVLDLVDVVRSNVLTVVVLKQPFQTLVPEALDHVA